MVLVFARPYSSKHIVAENGDDDVERESKKGFYDSQYHIDGGRDGWGNRLEIRTYLYDFAAMTVKIGFPANSRRTPQITVVRRRFQGT